MDTNQKSPLSSIHYKDFVARVLMAVFGVFAIQANGRWSTVLETITAASIGRSLVIALLLLYYLNLITHLLDRRFDLSGYPRLRLILQSVLGLLLPCILVRYLAPGYFRLIGAGADEISFFLLIQFPVLCLLLILANCYYLSYAFLYFIGIDSRRHDPAEQGDGIEERPDGEDL